MNNEQIVLGHGNGGKLSHDLVRSIMWPAFKNDILGEMHDSAKLEAIGGKLAFTTDSYVVKPLFFTGGDIGKLAVCGTVNDLAMGGAKPMYLSVGFIIEEGFLLKDLTRIVQSMQQAANEAGVQIVTGDTKVVEKGAIDGLYINTAGIGKIMDGVNISGKNAYVGQDIILSGFIGEHALAVMNERHGLSLPPAIKSDCAPLSTLVNELLKVIPQITVLRDVTRGGLATTLNEIALESKVGILIEENMLPISTEVQAICDILGFDPLYLANEGKFLLFVEKRYTNKVLTIMHNHIYGKHACRIGEVASSQGQVGLKTTIGGIRLLDMLVGDQLPRIC